MTMYASQYADINGDGEPEEIHVNLYEPQPGYEDSQIHVYVNGKDTACYTGTQSWFDSASLMKTEDGDFYLYIDVSEIDSVDRIFVFSFSGGGAIHEGEYQGGLEGFITDPGRFKVFSHLDVLGTHSGYKYYHVGNDGLPEPDDKTYTIVRYQYGDEPEPCLTSKVPVAVWFVGRDGRVEEEPQELPAGTRFYFCRTDNRSYVEMELEDGRRCQVRVDLSSWPRTVNGMEENECFDGIMYAG